MTIRTTVLVYILIGAILLFGWLQIKYLKADLVNAQTQVQSAQIEIKSLHEDMDRFAKVQNDRQDNRITYQKQVTVIQKEKTKESVKKIEQNPTEYINKVNLDYQSLSNQFSELSK